jgi:hypothetical protein
LLPGSNSTCYEVFFVANGSIVAAAQRVGGVAPADSDSGEIFIKLDWSQYSGGSYSTTQIAQWVVPALLDGGFIPELGGRALAELPLHLVGHSRGASVMAEISRLLGAQGVWVDHLTFLDPRPVGLFGDPSVQTFANVLFADCFWQNLGNGLTVPNGSAISGAYNRQLTNLNGGYSSSHSDTHLWYHGTIDLATPLTDTQASLTASERAVWWTPTEAAGAANGFFLSRTAGGDRLGFTQYSGTTRPRDGFNQQWDLGAGVNPNRAALPANNGAWPNLLRCDLVGTSHQSVDDPFAVRVYFQFGQTAPANTTLQFYLDPDASPFNANATLVGAVTDTGTGTAAVKTNSLPGVADPAVVTPGNYFIATRISGNGRARWLYAPQCVTLTASRVAPRLTPTAFTNDTVRLRVDGYAGQTVILQRGTNLAAWADFATNTLTAPVWERSEPASALEREFYRARLNP